MELSGVGTCMLGVGGSSSLLWALGSCGKLSGTCHVDVSSYMSSEKDRRLAYRAGSSQSMFASEFKRSDKRVIGRAESKGIRF